MSIDQFNAITIEQMETSEIFYSIPKVLLEDEQYKELRLDSKMLYAILKDRLKLSAKNRWIDEQGRVYLEYSNKELQEIFNCSKNTIIKIRSDLTKHGLIYEESQFTKADGQVSNRIYVGNVIDYNSEKYHLERQKRQEEAFQKRQAEKLNHPGSKNERGAFTSCTGAVQDLNPNNIESSEIDSSKSNDTSRYKGELSSKPLSISEAFKLREHSFLTEQIVIELASFGELAPILQDKIFQAKRAVEKQFDYQLKDRFPLFSDTEKPRLYGEFFVDELYREVTKLRSKVSIGQVNGRPVRDITGYFYRMLTLFWKKCLWLVLHYDFIALEQRKNAGEILLELVDTSVKDIDDELYLWVGKEVI
ncbi:replication initiator protein A [Streptococcus sp. E17BB]|uniref:replication initiator protein A n=1 Tax=Streptococcus sp. E17BB TaxID=3278714 RepID=UPI00359E1CD4